MKDTFRFVETKATRGLVENLEDLAREEGRSLNNYVSRVLDKHVKGENKEESNDIK
jgi:predicted HicB family RNase H-like nuclease